MTVLTSSFILRRRDTDQCPPTGSPPVASSRLTRSPSTSAESCGSTSTPPPASSTRGNTRRTAWPAAPRNSAWAQSIIIRRPLPQTPQGGLCLRQVRGSPLQAPRHRKVIFKRRCYGALTGQRLGGWQKGVQVGSPHDGRSRNATNPRRPRPTRRILRPSRPWPTDELLAGAVHAAGATVRERRPRSGSAHEAARRSTGTDRSCRRR